MRDDDARAEGADSAEGADAAHVTERTRVLELYSCVRRWAEHVRDTVADGPLTEIDRERRRALAPLWDASPETVAGLRRMCWIVGGARASDYGPSSEPQSVAVAQRLRRELGMLWKQVGRDLFVPESPVLGGFGHEKKGDLYNEDTVTYFKALIGLRDGAVLSGLSGSERRLVWEVRGGWGGFARSLKMVCPNVTYLVTAPPERFLLAAMYVMTTFPDARCRFFDPAQPAELWRDWDRVDFVFVPEGALGGGPRAAAASGGGVSIRPPRLDLVVDLLSFDEMDATFAAANIEQAFAWGCPYTYSLIREHEGAAQSSAAWRATSQRYWPNPIPPRREPSRPRPADADSSAGAHEGPSHLVGWRRIRASASSMSAAG